MTQSEAAAVRDLVARNRELERENRYLRAQRNKARTERDRARDNARWLHGLLVAARINPLRKAA